MVEWKLLKPVPIAGMAQALLARSVLNRLAKFEEPSNAIKDFLRKEFAVFAILDHFCALAFNAGVVCVRKAEAPDSLQAGHIPDSIRIDLNYEV